MAEFANSDGCDGWTKRDMNEPAPTWVRSRGARADAILTSSKSGIVASCRKPVLQERIEAHECTARSRNTLECDALWLYVRVVEIERQRFVN